MNAAADLPVPGGVGFYAVFPFLRFSFRPGRAAAARHGVLSTPMSHYIAFFEQITIIINIALFPGLPRFFPLNLLRKKALPAFSAFTLQVVQNSML
jgi:hypothetical protein